MLMKLSDAKREPGTERGAGGQGSDVKELSLMSGFSWFVCVLLFLETDRSICCIFREKLLGSGTFLQTCKMSVKSLPSLNDSWESLWTRRAGPRYKDSGVPGRLPGVKLFAMDECEPDVEVVFRWYDGMCLMRLIQRGREVTATVTVQPAAKRHLLLCDSCYRQSRPLTFGICT